MQAFQSNHIEVARMVMAQLYECADCGARYLTRHELLQHVETLHGIEVVDDDVKEEVYQMEDTHLADAYQEEEADPMEEEDDSDEFEVGSVKPKKGKKRSRSKADSDTEYNPRADLKGGNSAGKSNGSAKSHHCRYCSKSFPRNYCVKRHERMHTGERPFQCKECSRSFSDRSNLLQHVRSQHTKERTNTYFCTPCNHRFAEYNYVRRHLRKIHEGILSFICPEPCGIAFCSQEEWDAHEAEHGYPIKPYTVNDPNSYKNKSFQKPKGKPHSTAGKKGVVKAPQPKTVKADAKESEPTTVV